MYLLVTFMCVTLAIDIQNIKMLKCLTLFFKTINFKRLHSIPMPHILTEVTLRIKFFCLLKFRGTIEIGYYHQFNYFVDTI